MKKAAFALLVAALAVPALAEEEKALVPGRDVAAVEQVKKDHRAFKKARAEHQAKMKATQEKMGKLVKEYNKLKDGSKKEAKRAEIEKEVGAIHEEQLKFKADQLGKFETRLATMKEEFAQESSAEGKQAWAQKKTDDLIKADGDLRVLFALPQGHGPHGKHFHKRPHGPHGFKGPRPDGPRPDGAQPPAPRN